MKTSDTYRSLGVANALLDAAQRHGIKLTLMQLIKLVYLANGWAMALLNKPLTNEPVQAWQYGPVFPSIYRHFKRFGPSPVTEPAIEEFTETELHADLDSMQLRVIDAVVRAYGKRHAFELSELMHRPGTPWSITIQKSGPYSEIPAELVKSHFDKLKSEKNGSKESGY